MAYNLQIGQKVTLTATLLDAGDQVVRYGTGMPLEWESDDTGVCTVTFSEHMRWNTASLLGIAAGSATITCTSGVITQTFDVTVSDGGSVSSITITAV
jgi:uncharacterized protein YjdB